MIKPSIGRVVWYWPHGQKSRAAGEQARAAIVTYVHGDRMVNLAVFDPNGHVESRTSVHLEQDGDTDAEFHSSFASWMPYQIGQAKAVAS